MRPIYTACARFFFRSARSPEPADALTLLFGYPALPAAHAHRRRYALRATTLNWEKADKTTKDSSLTAAEKESRLKRIKEKLVELQAEEKRSAGKVVEVDGKASRTLIMELSIEYVHLIISKCYR